MNLEQAYINGFVKRAAQYGYNHLEAINILKAADAELKGKQYKLDVDKDGKIEASDLKKLRQRKQAADATTAPAPVVKPMTAPAPVVKPMTAPGTLDTAIIDKFQSFLSPSNKKTPPQQTISEKPALTGNDAFLKALGLPMTEIPPSDINAYQNVLSSGSASASAKPPQIKRTLPPSGGK